MKFVEVIDLDDDKYPFTRGSEEQIANFDAEKWDNIFEHGAFVIYRNKKSVDRYAISAHGEMCGVIDLSQYKGNHYAVINVYILPKYRNTKLGIMLYKFIIQHERKNITTSAAQTVASSRIWLSMFNDPSIDIFGTTRDEFGQKKYELYVNDENRLVNDEIPTRDLIRVATAA